jgi:hypothetical protein
MPEPRLLVDGLTEAIGLIEREKERKKMRQSTYPIEPTSPAETERGRKKADPINPSVAFKIKI